MTYSLAIDAEPLTFGVVGMCRIGCKMAELRFGLQGWSILLSGLGLSRIQGLKNIYRCGGCRASGKADCQRTFATGVSAVGSRSAIVSGDEYD